MTLKFFLWGNWRGSSSLLQIFRNHPHPMFNLQSLSEAGFEFTYKPKIEQLFMWSLTMGKNAQSLFHVTRLSFFWSWFSDFYGREIDAIYTEILPVGSIVELDEECCRQPLKISWSIQEWTSCCYWTKTSFAGSFDVYIVDYYAYVQHSFQLPATRPMFISNMMIKRVVHHVWVIHWTKRFHLMFFEQQLAKEQISSTASICLLRFNTYYKRLAQRTCLALIF